MTNPNILSVLKLSNKEKALFIILLGSIVSVWCSCLLDICFRRFVSPNSHQINSNFDVSIDLILSSVQITYLLVYFICNIALYYGIRKKLGKYYIAWGVLKLCEAVIIIAGIFVISIADISLNALIVIEAATLVLNVYTSICVYQSYKLTLTKIPIHVKQVQLQQNVKCDEVTTNQETTGNEESS